MSGWILVIGFQLDAAGVWVDPLKQRALQQTTLNFLCQKITEVRTLKEITYKLLKEANLEEVFNLYRLAGWWNENDDRIGFLADLIRETFLFVGAFDEGKLIGMGRSISDGVSDAYIQDVTVLPEYRRQGIGGQIIQILVQNLKQRDINWIGLIGEPGTQHFYEELGFSLMKDYIPMMYKGKK